MIEKLYVERPDEDLHTDSHLREFVSKIKGAMALIIAPGRSAAEQAGDIIEFAARSRAVTFSGQLLLSLYDHRLCIYQ